ncbi:Leucine-rich repeat-containing protein 15 [Holothuria leucospilota]|uniref:Leucine-rich repeat-containing protein 15 n=1 Tax=Holothuria leucospilota TaxID=206669 RepID=A0A9Q1CRL3_HOLLE|nr:Leucine-rich repeat-containing protein 15 [Holothuria leucospilota]
MLRNTVFFISLLSRIFISHGVCINHFDVYDECANPFPSGCCVFGSAFICNGVNVTDANDFADEIPQTSSDLFIANTNKSFINDGDWKFLYNLSYLQELSFNNHKISNLGNLKSVYLKDLVQLKLLSLSVGNLRKFPVEQFTNLMSLRYLDLSCNKLQSIGEERWNFSLLNDLILSNNRLTAVRAEQLKGLGTLSTLDLSYNRISYFSAKVLESMPNLKYLHLSFNRLLHVSDHSQRHTKLIFWGISSNLFVSLEPSIFHDFKSLHTIDYTKNSIKDPPRVYSKNNETSAVVLSLQFNVIEILSPLFFDHFPHLNGINVANNRIRQIEENAFRSVPNVTVISLSDNKINTIPIQLFQHLKNIEILNVQFNRIQILHPQFLLSLNTDVQLFIYGNPILCDCQAVPLLKWLILSATPPSTFPSCQSPEELQNQSIYDSKLPEDCHYSTSIPASTEITPTSYRNPLNRDVTFMLIIGSLIVVLICIFSKIFCPACKAS